MSTRSTIAKLQKDGNVKLIYCHLDGCLSGVGQILLNHYSDPNKICELIALGSISSLGENVRPTKTGTYTNWTGKPVPLSAKAHNFDTPQDGCTIAFGRDRGDEDMDAYEISFEEWKSGKLFEEWNYLFKKGKWYYMDENSGKLVKLTLNNTSQ